MSTERLEVTEQAQYRAEQNAVEPQDDMNFLQHQVKFYRKEVERWQERFNRWEEYIHLLEKEVWRLRHQLEAVGIDPGEAGEESNGDRNTD